MDLDKYDMNLITNPFGLVNKKGFLCYFNSLTQALISCSSFNKIMIEIDISNIKTEHNEEIIIKQFKDLFKIHNDYHEYIKTITGKRVSIKDLIPEEKKRLIHLRTNLQNQSYYIWNKMIQVLLKKSKEIASFAYGQQDAKEGFHLLLQSLESFQSIQNLFLHRRVNKLFCPNCQTWFSQLNEMNLSFDVEANLKLEQLENFKELDNTLGKEQGLNEFLLQQNNYVDINCECSNCKIRSEKYRESSLVMVPEILFVMSKKYDITLKKLNIFTDFPIKLKFKGVTTDLIYEPVAQIEHVGNLNGGHYWAICKRKNGWFNLNDNSMSNSEFKPTPNTYIVLYHIM